MGNASTMQARGCASGGVIWWCLVLTYHAAGGDQGIIGRHRQVGNIAAVAPEGAEKAAGAGAPHLNQRVVRAREHARA